MGSSDQLNATAGLTFINDDSNTTAANGPDATAWLVDFHGNLNNIGFGAEVADLDDDITFATDEDFSNLATPLVIQGDSMPFSFYGTFQLNPDWEFGVRYEDLDNGSAGGADNTIISLAANYFRPGNGGKWQAQISSFDADSGFPDGEIFEVGYSIGSTR